MECRQYKRILTRKRTENQWGKKAELVALAYSANPLGIKTKTNLSDDRRKNQIDYQSLLKLNNGCTLPDPLKELSSGWESEENGISKWPRCMYFDIAHYLIDNVETSLRTRLMSDYKEGNAYSYFDSKWRKEVKCHSITEDWKYCFLRAECTKSQRLNDVPHEAWVCLEKKTGKVVVAYCRCFSGFFCFSITTCRSPATLVLSSEI